ncbi:MAG: nucleotidyltransferase domain-containing protein [Candidatus Hydrogenedentes bacterium]|nr:nucleotidyltransferase domain-containing protein [Candidatus Hydrogenedentota bacterium]
MNALAEILSSRVRAEIFRLLFGVGCPELHVREIQRRTGFNDRAVRQELAKLSRLGLVESRTDGNRRYYRASTSHPVYPEIRGLALKLSGLTDLLRERLQSDDIRLAFVFGSIANGTARPDSDIDLMVIGKLGMRELTRLLKGTADEVGRTINPYILTQVEFRKRVSQKEHFVRAVLASPKIIIKGSEDELARLGA